MSNYKFKTTNIRGKQYVEVNERIKFFRQEEQYKNWTIATEFPVLDGEVAVCKATIADTDGRVVATGHAHEERSGSNINKTSFVENCETSAVGRALQCLESESTLLLRQLMKSKKQSQSNRRWSTTPKSRSLAKLWMRQSRTSWTKQWLHQVPDRQEESFHSITKKYGEQLTEKQVAGLKKFVR